MGVQGVPNRCLGVCVCVCVCVCVRVCGCACTQLIERSNYVTDVMGVAGDTADVEKNEWNNKCTSLDITSQQKTTTASNEHQST